MQLAYVVGTTLLTALAVVLLSGLRAVGLYSHQALAVAVILGLGWAVVSRAALAWRGQLSRRFPWEWRAEENRALRLQVAVRASFWLVLGGTAVYVFPRSADVSSFNAVLVVLVLLRVIASFFPSRTANVGPTVVAALATGMFLVDLARAIAPTAAPVVRLEPPFAGDWLVLQGGRSPLQSHHLVAFNQEYAVDLVRLVEGGVFVEGGEGNAMSGSWEAPLFAPIAGRVVVATDSMEDSVGLNLVTDPAEAAGNTLVIATETGHYVLLAHLRKGSLRVHEGEVVAAGQAVALTGNSGNTTMSHLHLQVQTHAELWDPDNRSVPFAFGADGATPRRNDHILGTAAP